MEEEDSPLVFLEKVHLFRERVEEFIKTPLPSVINLSVTPRAAEYLQQHWPAVTIGSLEEAPIPKVCCCARCGSAETTAARDRPEREVQDLWGELRPTAAVLLVGLLLLLLLAGLWVNPVGGASLCFSLLSRFSQLLHGASSELLTSVWDTAGSVYTVMDAAVEGWRAHLSAAGDKFFQRVGALFKNLTSR